MVRNYKKKKEKDVNEIDAERAVLSIVNDGLKLRTAAALYNINPSTLFYRVKKYKENVIPKSKNFSSKHTVSQVFDNYEEDMLEKYFLKMSKMNYGLTYLQARELAYQYASAINKCCEKWKTNRMAGIEWMKCFMKRHKILSLRKPENTSLSRSTSFNKHNVMLFFNNYETILRRENFSADRIYNLDETNIMTVVQAPNVIARTGQKQVGQSVSAERGQLITMCTIVNALGNTIPPVFIFPRARFHDSMLSGAPGGSVGFANSPTSGWMTGPLFVKVLEHIQKVTRCTKDDKILILLDNHESHCTIDAINFSRENGIVLLTFPPHCTHKLQPLDVAVNGPFKAKLAVSQNDWLLNHPGKTITIYDLASIVTPAYNATHTINNITSGFSTPGIYPFSRNKFTDDDFECSEVTNRVIYADSVRTVPLIVASSQNLITNSAINTENVEAGRPAGETIQAADTFVPQNAELDQRNKAADHTLTSRNAENTSAELVLTPEAVKPFPKAAPRTGRTGRKKGSSRILTDSPEKNVIEAAHLERMKRVNKSSILLLSKRGKTAPKSTSKKSKQRKTSRKVQSTSESEVDENISVHDDSDMDVSDDHIDSELDNQVEDEESFHSLEIDHLNINDYILVQCHSAKNNTGMHFVAVIKSKDGNMFLVSFMKKKFTHKFFFPDKEDQSFVPITDIVRKLPNPCPIAGTSRTAALLSFKFDFTKFKLG